MKDCTGLADANSLKLRPSFATIKTVKPYNRTHTRCRQERVFAEGKSHRSICLFTFCALRKFLQRRAENVKPYNRTHTRCRQERVFVEGKSHRSTILYLKQFFWVSYAESYAGSYAEVIRGGHTRRSYVEQVFNGGSPYVGQPYATAIQDFLGYFFYKKLYYYYY